MRHQWIVRNAKRDLNESTNSKNSTFNQTTSSSNTSAYYTPNSSIVSQTINQQPKQQPIQASTNSSNHYNANQATPTANGSASLIKSASINSASSGIIPNHSSHKNANSSVTQAPSTVKQQSYNQTGSVRNLYSSKN